MKIIISESQYKRLLRENNTISELGISLPNIENSIDRFIIKIFQFLYKKNLIPDVSYLNYSEPPLSSKFREIAKISREYIGLTLSESFIISHNYSSVYWNDIVSSSENNDWSSLIGKPLEFYGKFIYPTVIYYSGYLYGSAQGKAYAYGRNIDDFIKHKNEETVELDAPNDWDISYDAGDTDWEVNWDGSYEFFRQDDIEEDNIVIDLE